MGLLNRFIIYRKYVNREILWRNILPPIIYNKIKNNKCPLNEKIKTFNSFIEAEKHGKYNDKRIVDVVVEKSKIYKRNNAALKLQDIKNLFFIEKAYSKLQNKLQVLDVGGACGTTYYPLEPYIKAIVSSWTILETPLMAQKSTDLFTTETISFISSIHSITKAVNIALFQGSFQYIENPLEYLNILNSKDVKFIYFSRFTVSIDCNKTIIYNDTSELKNHGPGQLQNINNIIIKTATNILPFSVLKKHLDYLNYSLYYDIDESQEYTLHFDVGTIQCQNKTLFFQKKNL